jgi:protein involved in polysaccharide export with SLBB domain
MRIRRKLSKISLLALCVAASLLVFVGDHPAKTALAGFEARPDGHSSATSNEGENRPLLPARSALSSAAPGRCGQLVDSSENGVGALGRGDKLKLSFYEILASQDDRWGAERQHLQEPAKAFQLRAELSTEYLVQDDGSISIPILGVFPAAGRDPSQLQRQLECAFGAFVGREGFVNVLSVVKPPVYVVGKVKNAGSYAYVPGMTVLHAVALAGGFDKSLIEPYQVAELTRESERMQSSLDRAMRMIARTSAIEAVRTDGPAKAPAELVEIAGQTKGNSLVRDEFAPRHAEMQAVVADEASLKGSIDAAAAALTLRQGHLPELAKMIDLRRERVANLTKLVSLGSLGRPVLMQAQTELMDAEERRQETQNSINVAQQQLNRSRQELQNRRAQAEIALQKEESEAHLEAAVAADDSGSSANVLKAMAKTHLATMGSLNTQFMVIRRAATGVVQIPATDTTVLEPGDLVQATSAVDSSAKD